MPGPDSGERRLIRGGWAVAANDDSGEARVAAGPGWAATIDHRSRRRLTPPSCGAGSRRAAGGERMPARSRVRALPPAGVDQVSASAASIASRPAVSPGACTGWIATCVAPAAKCARRPFFTVSVSPQSTIESMNASEPPFYRSASVKPIPSQELR